MLSNEHYHGQHLYIFILFFVLSVPVLCFVFWSTWGNCSTSNVFSLSVNAAFKGAQGKTRPITYISVYLICWELFLHKLNLLNFSKISAKCWHCTLQTIRYWTDSVTLYLYLITVKTWSETESCQMSGVLFTWSLSDLVTAVRLIKWLCFCLWVQTPSEQGTSNARETTDQQCWQEKETHWGEWWADQNKFYSFIFPPLFCPVIILSYLSVHSTVYFKLLYY